MNSMISIKAIPGKISEVIPIPILSVQLEVIPIPIPLQN